MEEEIDQAAIGGGRVGRVADCCGDFVRGFEADGKLVAETGEVGGGEKGCGLGDTRESGETEIAIAVGGAVGDSS